MTAAQRSQRWRAIGCRRQAVRAGTRRVDDQRRADVTRCARHGVVQTHATDAAVTLNRGSRDIVQGRLAVGDGGQPHAQHRSEEHTSELQSLIRISYAVFCLKTKQPTTPNSYYVY